MRAETPDLLLIPEIPADEANSQQVARMREVGRQRAQGRTGGGMKCPSCKQRRLRSMSQSRLFQCQDPSCSTVVMLVLGAVGFELREVEGLGAAENGQVIEGEFAGMARAHAEPLRARARVTAAKVAYFETPSNDPR